MQCAFSLLRHINDLLCTDAYDACMLFVRLLFISYVPLGSLTSFPNATVSAASLIRVSMR